MVAAGAAGRWPLVATQPVSQRVCQWVSVGVSGCQRSGQLTLLARPALRASASAAVSAILSARWQRSQSDIPTETAETPADGQTDGEAAVRQTDV